MGIHYRIVLITESDLNEISCSRVSVLTFYKPFYYPVSKIISVLLPKFNLHVLNMLQYRKRNVRNPFALIDLTVGYKDSESVSVRIEI